MMLTELAALLERRGRKHVLWLLGLALLGAVAEAIGIGAVMPFISLLANPSLVTDNATVHAVYEWTGAPGIERFVMLCGFALLLIFYAKNAYLGLFYFLQTRFVCAIESRLANRLLAAYLHAPYAVRLVRNSSDRIRLITAEVSRVTNGFLMPLLVLITESMVILGIAGILLWMQPVAALLAMVLVGGVGVLLQRSSKRRLEHSREERVRSSKAMYQWASQGLGALKETKALGREDFFLRRFGDNSRAYARATSTFTVLNLMPRLAVETLAVTALLLAVIVGLAAGQPMRGMVPLLTLFGLAAVRIMPSATRIMGALTNLRFYAPSLAEVAGDLSVAETGASVAPASPSANVVPWTAGAFELRNVSFRYPGSELDSLRGVSVRIARGEIVGVVGSSGSGKTTLADLLLGLLAPDAGEILVDGKAIAPVGMRGLTGLVPQQFYLLDDTVRRNVAFGREDGEIDDVRVWRALDRAQLGDRVRALPQQLDEAVREQGAILSGGERQRLSIARALYDDPAILVLDEATSALDSATEAELMATLRDLALTKAVVLITHRPLSMAACDRIILMCAGCVTAEGTFAGLSAANAVFRDLVCAEEPAPPTYCLP